MSKDLLVPSAVPVASFVASRKLLLEAAQPESQPGKMRLNRGIHIIGIVVTVARTGTVGQGTVVPTVDDIDLRVESTDLRLTRDASDENDRDTYADATAISLPMKFTDVVLAGSPDVTVQVRWKSEDHAAIFQDCIVSVSVLYNWADAERG